MRKPDSFVCDMKELSREQGARHHELATLLQSLQAAGRELADDYDFEFP
jgi:hypothetical protein